MDRVDVLAYIQRFEPVDRDWGALDELLGELWLTGVSVDCLPVLFGVFERYPEEDGAGVLWSVVHGVEALQFSYEQPLRESLARQPSLMGRVMLERLERANAV